MKLDQLPGNVNLTYCTNIHAGESWSDIRASLDAHVPAIKAAVTPDRPLGIVGRDDHGKFRRIRHSKPRIRYYSCPLQLPRDSGPHLRAHPWVATFAIEACR